MANKYALVMMSNSDYPEGRGRMVHVLQAALDLVEAGHEVKIHFHGAGVNWLTAFHERGDKFTQNYGPKFDAVKEHIAGTCQFCTEVRFDAAAGAKALGVPVVGGEGNHASLADIVADGSQILTF